MKTCITCKKNKRKSSFNKKISTNDGLQPHCRDCNRKLSRNYYAKHREKHKKITTKRKNIVIKKNLKIIVDYLKNHPCVDCGNDNIIVLDFDHVRGKKINSVITMIYRGFCSRKIIIEIEKCDIRCANCHRIKTAKQFSYYRNLL